MSFILQYTVIRSINIQLEYVSLSLINERIGSAQPVLHASFVSAAFYICYCYHSIKKHQPHIYCINLAEYDGLAQLN